jgi:paraquat-inducible protein B
MSDASPPVPPASQLPASSPETPEATLKPARRPLLGWYWVLPSAALLIVLLVVGLTLSQRGVRILVHFNDGHGLKGGDAVRCRGITVGEVRSVELAAGSNGVNVVIDLRPTARAVAVKESRFWIVRPQAAFTGVSGLDTVVGAKYVAILPGGGNPERRFVGLEEPPALELEPPEPGGLKIILEAERMSGLRPGVPLTYHQVRIGSVLASRLAREGGPVEVEVSVLPAYKELVRENSLFWNASGFKLQAGLASGLTLAAESLETVLAGGVAMSTPGKPGPAARDGQRFRLTDEPPKERGERIVVHFNEGHGLKAGDPLRHRGITLGEVHSVELSPGLQGVDVTIDLRPQADRIAVDGSRFWIVRPQAALTGVSGLDTVVGAKYVAVLPGSGAGQRKFVGEENPVMELEPGGLEIVVQDRRSGGLRPGAPLTYRGVRIGSVLTSGLVSDASAVEIRVYVLPAYKSLVRANSVFWNVSGVKVGGSILSGRLALDFESAETVLAGGLAMATPSPPKNEVRDGERFPLADKEPEKWHEWNPSIVLTNPNLPDNMKAPRLVKGTLTYRVPGRFYGTKARERRGLVLPTDGTWLLGLGDLLSVPEKATESLLAFEGAAQPIAPGKETDGLCWLEVKDAAARQALKEFLPRDRLQAPSRIEDCLLVADSTSAPLFVSAGHLSPNEAVWAVDDALSGALVREQWHGAAAVSVVTGKVIGFLQVPEKGLKCIIPLTEELLRRRE